MVLQSQYVRLLLFSDSLWGLFVLVIFQKYDQDKKKHECLSKSNIVCLVLDFKCVASSRGKLLTIGATSWLHPATDLSSIVSGVVRQD